jgi:hypothetical protein
MGKNKDIASTKDKIYSYAKKNKSEDRLTEKDIEASEKILLKMDELPEGLKKDTTTGFGANITVEGKSMGGEIEVGKGGDYIKDLID